MFFFGRRQVEPRGVAKPAEFVIVGANAAQLKFDFIAERADGSHAATRVFLGRNFAEKAATALESTITLHTNKHGPIRVSREQRPLEFRFTSLSEYSVNQLKTYLAEGDCLLDFRLTISSGGVLSEFDRVVFSMPMGLAPTLLADMRACLEDQRRSLPWPQPS